MSIIINPGSGPVDGAEMVEAIDNIITFIADIEAAGRTAELVDDEVPPRDCGDGRFEFQVVVDGKVYEIEMPGLPIAQVRFVGDPEQNIWDFPRLYVDGSSWVWCFALSACESDEDDDEGIRS